MFRNCGNFGRKVTKSTVILKGVNQITSIRVVGFVLVFVTLLTVFHGHPTHFTAKMRFHAIFEILNSGRFRFPILADYA